MNIRSHINSYSLAFSLCVVAAGSNANPSGGVVVAGSAQINTDRTQQLTITQHSDKAIIDWRSFSIDQGEQTLFQQPSTSSVVLNRVKGSESSIISGQLFANGNVFLVNSNGILFSNTAQVNAGGLIATTSDIDNNDFLAGRFEFNQPGHHNASVINAGQISIADKGLAALVAPAVANTGTIQAKLGKVTLASGDRFTVDFYGDELIQLAVNDNDLANQLERYVENSGLVESSHVIFDAQSAADVVGSVINTDGVVKAHSVEVNDGEIILRGDRINIAGKLEANGGDIHVAANDIVIADSAELSVSTWNGKHAGDIAVLAQDTASVSGKLNASAAGNQADGGFIEVSANILTLNSTIDVSSMNGASGSVLFDPVVFDIGTTEASTFVSALAGGGDVIVAASDTINLNADIDSSAQSSTASLSFTDQAAPGASNPDGLLTVNLNAAILLGNNQSLSGEASTVNVNSTSANIQNGIDIAASNATVNVSSNEYQINSTIQANKTGITLQGAVGSSINIGENDITAINVSADNVTVAGLQIFSTDPRYNTPLATRDWDGESSTGIAVASGVSNITISNNQISKVRSGLLLATNTTGSILDNLIDDTKGSLIIRSNNGYLLSNNAYGTQGNEWDIVFLENVVSGVGTSTPTAAHQQLLLNASLNNNGMTVLDRGYHLRNRSHALVEISGATVNASEDFGLGNGWGSIRQPFLSINEGINTLFDGGTAQLGSGTFVENVVIDRALNLRGAGRDATIIAANSGDNLSINSNIGDSATVTISDIGFSGSNGARRGIHSGSSTVLNQLNVQGTRYEDHIQNGLSIHGVQDNGSQLSNFSLNDAIFFNNGRAAGNGGRGDMVLFYFNNNATLNNVQISNDGSATVDARYGLQMRGVDNGSFSGNFQALGNVTLDNVSVSGTYAVAHLGVQGFDGIDGLTMNDVILGGAGSRVGWGGSFWISSVTQSNDTNLNLGNTNFAGTLNLAGEANYDIVTSSEGPVQRINVDATQASFAGTATGAMSKDQLFDAADRVFDGIDHSSSRGFIRLRNDNVYVTQQSRDIEAGAIQRAINNANISDTVSIAEGTFSENIVIDRPISIVGSGRDLTTIAASSGDNIILDSDIGALSIVNISDIGLSGSNGAARGIHVGGDAVLAQLNVTNTRYFEHSDNGFAVIGTQGASTAASRLGELQINDAIFANNGQSGGSEQRGDLLLFYFNSPASLNNIQISNDGSADALYGLQLRGIDNGSFNGGFQSLANTSLTDINIAGTYAGAHLGITGFDGTNSLTMTDVVLGSDTSRTGTGGSLWVSSIAQTSDSILNLGNTNFAGTLNLAGEAQSDIIVSSAGPVQRVVIDATNAEFNGVASNTMDTADLYAVSDRIYDNIDDASSRGLVRLRNNSLYVTQSSNDLNAGAIQRAITNADTNDSIHIQNGVYNESLDVSKSVSLRWADIGVTLNSFNSDADLMMSGLLRVTGDINASGALTLIDNLDFDTSLANANIDLLGAIDGTSDQAQNFNLTAGSGDVSTRNMGLNVRLGDVVINANDYDGSTGTTNVSSLTINGKNIALGNNTVNATDDVNVSATQISGSINANNVSLTASENINSIVNAGIVSINAVNVDSVITATGDITINADDIAGSVDGDDINLTSAGDINATITADNNVVVSSETITAGIDAKGDVTVTADSIGGIISGSDIDLSSSGELSATVSANQSIVANVDLVSGDINAAGDVAVTADSISGNIAGNNVNLSSSGELSASVEANQSVVANVANVSGNINAIGDINVTASSIGGSISGSDINLSSSGALTATVEASQGIVANAITISGDISATGNIDVTAQSIGGSIAGNDINLTSGETINATVTAGRSITASGTSISGSITAANNIDLSANQISGSISAETINATANESIDSVINAGRTVTANAPTITGTVNAESATLQSQGTIQIAANIGTLVLSSLSTEIDGEVENTILLPDSQPAIVNDTAVAELPKALSTPRRIQAPETVGSPTPAQSQIAQLNKTAANVSLNYIEESSQGTRAKTFNPLQSAADLGNEFLQDFWQRRSEPNSNRKVKRK